MRILQIRMRQLPILRRRNFHCTEGGRTGAGKGRIDLSKLRRSERWRQRDYDGQEIWICGNEMVIEEFMTGREVSVLSFVDGNTIKTMTSAQDHKRAGDGDTGLNTGGMGTFSPSPFYTKEVEDFCNQYIYQATVDAMKAEGRPFKGCDFLRTDADGRRAEGIGIQCKIWRSGSTGGTAS